MELKSDEKKICSHYCIGPIVLSNYTTRHFPVIGHFFMTLELEMSLRMSDQTKILLPKYVNQHLCEKRLSIFF